MIVYVAMVGAHEGREMPFGVFESVELAMEGLVQYAQRNECYFAMNDYYEVYPYKLGEALDVRSSNQEPIDSGEFSELLEEEDA